jgi:decaprenylphospho-beta-D-ribofuranose 2-oxidase
VPDTVTAPAVGVEAQPVPLTGWGRTAATPAVLQPVRSDDDAISALKSHSSRGLVARGLARSYGDAAQNAGGHVLDMTTANRVLHADLATGLVDVEAGISLDELMNRFVPQGFFVPVTAGTRYVTVGGAIAADIHGKNHHVAGSFSQHVRWLDLLTADGQVRRVSPETDADLFWATAGGMGLTGIILRARVQLKAIETSRCLVDTDRTQDLDSLMTLLTETDHLYEYSVAWIDTLAKGKRMGRSVVTRGRFATLDELPAKRRTDPLRYHASMKVSVPDVFPPGLLNLGTVAAFNELWYRKAPKRKRDQLQSIPTFFHPLDAVGGWNRIYGPRGFVQYQVTVPFGQEEAMREVLDRLSSFGTASFLAVLKRFGPGNPGMLSYPSPGWTLALDIPVMKGLAGLLDSLDEVVVAARGRTYLAKDSRVRPETFEKMYDRLDDFRAVRKRVDPDGVFTSDLARRLAL